MNRSVSYKNTYQSQGRGSQFIEPAVHTTLVAWMHFYATAVVADFGTGVVATPPKPLAFGKRLKYMAMSAGGTVCENSHSSPAVHSPSRK